MLRESDVHALVSVAVGGDYPAAARLRAPAVGVDLGERRPLRRDY